MKCDDVCIAHQRMREIGMGPGGNLWLATDTDDGGLVRIAASK